MHLTMIVVVVIIIIIMIIVIIIIIIIIKLIISSPKYGSHVAFQSSCCIISDLWIASGKTLIQLNGAGT